MEDGLGEVHNEVLSWKAGLLANRKSQGSRAGSARMETRSGDQVRVVVSHRTYIESTRISLVKNSQRQRPCRSGRSCLVLVLRTTARVRHRGVRTRKRMQGEDTDTISSWQAKSLNRSPLNTSHRPQPTAHPYRPPHLPKIDDHSGNGANRRIYDTCLRRTEALHRPRSKIRPHVLGTGSSRGWTTCWAPPSGLSLLARTIIPVRLTPAWAEPSTRAAGGRSVLSLNFKSESR